jgi:fatty-acyl-CoA synthase
MHPSVTDVAVIGVPHDDLVEEVRAVVEPAASAEVGDELTAELIAYCRSHLASYKCPRSIDYVQAMPRSDTGKLSKAELRRRYWVTDDPDGAG